MIEEVKDLVGKFSFFLTIWVARVYWELEGWGKQDRAKISRWFVQDLSKIYNDDKTFKDEFKYVQNLNTPQYMDYKSLMNQSWQG